MFTRRRSVHLLSYNMASSSPPDSHDKTTPPFLYTISKVQVAFPVKPYRVQMYALVKIIKALNTTTNTLLELPTGSGKTLALLCGTLAWQRHELAELTRLMQQQIEEDRIIEEQIMEIDLSESEISIHTEETINAAESVEEENRVTEINDRCICPDRKINENTCKSDRVELDECSVENYPGVLRREKQRRIDNEEEEKRGEEEKTKGCSSNEGKQLVKSQQEIMMNTLSSDDENTDDFAEKPKNLTKMTANQNNGSKNMTAQSKTSSPNNNQKKDNRSKVSVNIETKENNENSTASLKNSHEDVEQQSKYCKRADNNVEDSDEDLDDFCVRPRKITKKEDSSQMVAQQQSPNFRSLSQCSVAGGSEQPSCSSPNSKQASQQCEGPKTQGIIPRVPKIYYCSRSHAQLNQVIAELRKTEYKDVNMTVLSSREFTCIQNRGSARNKTELCKKLLDPIEGYGCMYYHNVSRMSTHAALKQNTPLGTPWDIEDLVTAGRKLWACPYFTARELIASADIVFCPYIYLIDPKISSSMKLDIAGAIIVLDEAHNIEECCREAASYSASCYELEEAVKDCRRVATLDVLPELHNKLAKFLTNLLGWISEKVKSPYVVHNKYKEKTENVFSGIETTVNLERHNVTLQDISEFKNLTQEAMIETNKEENKVMMRIRGQRYGIVPTTKTVLLGISYVMGFMYDNNMQHLRDYFVVISKTSVLSGTSLRDLPEDFRDSEANELRSGNEFWSERNYFINFLCMNPAVIFKPISEKARTIVLASGTLSPLDTYESELGAVFPFPISTSHIIGKGQVFVAAVSQGPTGKILLANYAQTQNGPFKDELGLTILEICKCVPYGVLCFLPSYSLLKTLEMRWMETKLWSQLEEYKVVMCEPQNSREYPAVVEAFQNCVKHCEQGMGNGPLLFAVMRGKASEGMNFADNMARAVISVGIPYPHLRNILVILKRYYNTTYCRAQNLENGEVWYRTQAYRALNQALGRCIRHSKDWGTLIMIDERLTSNSGQINSLSKWIGENMQIFKYYAPFHSQLKSFIKSHVEADTEAK